MTILFQDELQGPRLILKRTTPSDELAQTIFVLADENREYLEKWLDWVEPTKEAGDILQYLNEKEEKYENKTKVEYGIYFNEIYMGNIAVFDIDSIHKSGEIGYWIGKEFSGKGFMTEALAILEKEAFENMGLHRVQIICDIENEPSIKVALKNNYQFEGTLRGLKFSPYFNEFRDMKMYSKLKSEYHQKK